MAGTATVPDLGPRPTKALVKQANDAARDVAIRRRDNRLAALSSGRPIDATKTTVGQYADHWLKLAEYRKLRPRSLKAYRWCVGVIKTAIGHIRLADLRREHVVELWDACAGEGSRAAVHSGLKMLLRAAAEEDYPLARSVLSIKAPSYTLKEAPTMSAAQMQLFLSTLADPMWRALWRLAYVASLRESEVAGLVWGDLDEIHGQLALTHQLSGAGDERVELKATRQRRTITLDAETIRLLAEQRQGAKSGDWMFSRKGRPISAHYLWRHFKNTCIAAGLPAELRPHAIRSGAAMTALEAGADVETISRRLGHAAGSTVTSRFYLRRSGELDRKAAESIAKGLSANRGE